MRILGLDYGAKKTGVAITDELGITVQGLATINYEGKDKILLKKLDEIIEKYEISTIVVGNPINLKGEKTLRTKTTEEFVHKLKCKYNKIKIDMIDERLTTVQAIRTMNELNIGKNEKKNIIDTLAATYILEAYLMKNNI